MANTFRDDETLTRREFNSLVLEIDQEISIEDKEEFIDVIVFMPVVFAFENADPHD